MKLLRPAVIGLLLGGALLVFVALLGESLRIEALAIILAVIAAIFVGFALTDGRPNVAVVQSVVALIFVIVAALGLWINPWFIVAGLIAHGLWDWLHHRPPDRLALPGWYPPFCAVVDVTVGLGAIAFI